MQIERAKQAETVEISSPPTGSVQSADLTTQAVVLLYLCSFEGTALPANNKFTLFYHKD